MAAWWHHALRCCWSIRSHRYLTKNPGLVLIRGTGNRAFLYGTAPTLILWLHASFSPHRPPFSAQRTAVVLLRSCQSKLATLTVRSGEELYGGCAPFVALLFRKERIRGKVCSALWRRRKEKEQKHLSTPPGTRRRRKLSKEKKTKKKNKPASQGRTTCKWGKGVLWGAAFLLTGAARDRLYLDLTWIHLIELHPSDKQTRSVSVLLRKYFTINEARGTAANLDCKTNTQFDRISAVTTGYGRGLVLRSGVGALCSTLVVAGPPDRESSSRRTAPQPQRDSATTACLKLTGHLLSSPPGLGPCLRTPLTDRCGASHGFYFFPYSSTAHNLKVRRVLDRHCTDEPITPAHWCL